jgi:hypothetical protein
MKNVFQYVKQCNLCQRAKPAQNYLVELLKQKIKKEEGLEKGIHLENVPPQQDVHDEFRSQAENFNLNISPAYLQPRWRSWPRVVLAARTLKSCVPVLTRLSTVLVAAV